MTEERAWFRAFWPFGRRAAQPAEAAGVSPQQEAGSGGDHEEPGEIGEPVEPVELKEPVELDMPGRPAESDDRAAFPKEFAGLRHVGPKPPSYPEEPSAAADAREDIEGAVVPDTAADGFTAGGFAVRAASVAGDSHRYDGDPRQDALAAVTLGPKEHGMILAVVADGVGSQPYSHVGAGAACKATVAALASRAGEVEAALRGGLRDRLYFEVVHVIDEVAVAITAEAARLAKPGRELATTLRAVLVPVDPQVRARLAFSVGDGGTFRLAGTTWKPVRPGSGDNAGVHETATAVLPLQPEELAVDVWAAGPGETTVVCTDGFSEPLRDPEFARLLGEEWAQEEVPGMMRFLWQAQSRLRSYDDDRTVICIWESGSTSLEGSRPVRTSS